MPHHLFGFASRLFRSRRTPSGRRPGRANRSLVRGEFFDGLEERRLLASVAITPSGVLDITLTNYGERLQVSSDSSGAYYMFESQNPWTGTAPGVYFSSDRKFMFALTAYSDVFVSNAPATELTGVTFKHNLNDYTASFKVILDPRSSSVNFNGRSAFASGASLTVDTRAGIVVNSANITVVDGSLNLSGFNGSLAEGISVDNSWIGTNGNGEIKLNGNVQPRYDIVTSTYYGIRIANSTISGGSGAGSRLTLQGGGDSILPPYNPSESPLIGVHVGSGGNITSGGSDVSVIGQGSGLTGNGVGYGVSLAGGGRITAGGSGSVTVVGQGVANDTARGIGVGIAGGSRISATSGDVSVTGYGSKSAGANNYGVLVTGTGSYIEAGEGRTNLAVNGIGGGRGASSGNHGIYLSSGGFLRGSTSGTLSVQGTGGNSNPGATGGSNAGVMIESSSFINSLGGAIEVTGIGGGSGGSATGNWGVSLLSSSFVRANGPGTVTVNGSGGNSSGNTNYGVHVTSNSSIGSSSGSVQVLGRGGGSGASSSNHGIYLSSGGQIFGGGEAGQVAVVGFGGNNNTGATGGSNIGVQVESATSSITSNRGTVVVSGEGGGSGGLGAGNWGVSLLNGGLVTAAAATAAVTVTGTGGNSSGNANYGVYATGGTAPNHSRVTSSGGNVQVTGQGGGRGASSSNLGIYLSSGGQLTAGGTGMVTVLGYGGNSNAGATGGSNVGVQVESETSSITSAGGAVSVLGGGGGSEGSGDSNWGVYLLNGGLVTSAGPTAPVTVSGSGGGSSGSTNYGVVATGGTAPNHSRVTSSGGNVRVAGAGGGRGESSDNLGIYLANGGQVTAGGSGTVTVEGTGGNNNACSTGGSNVGILVLSATSSITSAGGAVQVTGTGGGSGGSGGDNSGLSLLGGGLVTSGSTTAAVTVTGTGGNSSGDFNYGVYVAGGTAPNHSRVTSTGGNVRVIGQGGGSRASASNSGVFLGSAGQLTAGGSGTVTIDGYGGNNTAGGSGGLNHGVLVAAANSSITSAGGVVTVTGSGGGSDGSGASNWGVALLNGGVVTSGGVLGTVVVTGTGGLSSGGSNYGVYATGGTAPNNSRITSAGNDVRVTGQGGGRGASDSNHGIYLSGGGQLTPTGSGRAIIQGTGGNNTAGGSGGSNVGVLVEFATSSITSSNARVTVTGTGGGAGGSGASNWGLALLGGGQVIAGGSGAVDVTGTGGASTGAANHGVYATGGTAPDGSRITSGSGNVRVVGGEGSGSDSLGIVLAGPATLTTALKGGTLTVLADSLDIGSGSSIAAAAAGTLTIQPRRPDVSVDLGGITETPGGPLALSAAEVGRLAGGTLTIGSPVASNLLISQPVTTPTGSDIQLLSRSTGGVIPSAAGTDLTMTGRKLSIPGTQLLLAIEGPAVDSGYHQLKVAGGVDLNGLSLVLNGSYVPQAGQVFTLVSATSLTGTFTGLANGTTFNFNGVPLTLLYSSTAVTLTVNSAPAVTTQPASLAVTAGATASFTAAASGYPMPTVQWQVNSGSGFLDIAGATSTTYNFTAAASDTGQQYRAVFTNSLGSATSTAATLTIQVAPAVTTQPASQTLIAGGTASFTAAASGNPTPTVQWQVDTGSGFSNIAGATSTTYSVTTAAADNGKQYRAVFTNVVGSATSGSASLTVQFAPIVTTPPASATVASGATATFTAAAGSNPASTVQWQLSTNGGTSWSDVPGATSTTYAFAAAAAFNSRQYRAVFTNTLGTTASSAATLTVNPPLVTSTTVQSSANPIRYGASVTFTATVTAGATGTVQFFDGVLPLGTPVALVGGTGTSAAAVLSAGVHSITAVYSGDAFFAESTSPVVSQTVQSPIQVGYLIQGNAGTYQIPTNGNTFAAASVVAGTLPGGLSLSNSGQIGGIPAAGSVGNVSLVIRVTPTVGVPYEQALTLTILANQFVDPNPSVGNGFGSSIVILDNGNVVTTAPFDDAGGLDAGAVYVFDGATGTVISTLRGSSAGDSVGSGGITALGNGNAVVRSPDWNNGAAAKAGAVTWVGGTAGINGVVSSDNSLVGTSANDRVGSDGITVLKNGQYVVTSRGWDNTGAADAGAVTWGSGTAGITGVVSCVNSLVGSTASDQLGSSGILALANGNYLVRSPSWNLGAGAVTWGSGTVGITGVVSNSNSLVGSSADDAVGLTNVIELSTGNYVVPIPRWLNGALENVGAVTWGRGTAGVTGFISSSNSLIGSADGDSVGTAVVALTNGNYVVRSPFWFNGTAFFAGAVTWANGATGLTGVVSTANSLVGSKTGDQVGSGVEALSNGNYVVRSPNWDNGAVVNAGAVTWGSGTVGITGVITSVNSLIGSTASDQVGSLGVSALSNGNYVVRTPNWDSGAVVNVGAVTWGSGTAGVTGIITSMNSLIGTTASDQVGSAGVTALSNGNYVVRSSNWDNGAVVDAGAVTWGSGTSGVSGVVTSVNSLVGSTASDQVGSAGVTALSNGNYVVRSSNWDNGAVVDAGAVTWGSGTSGVSGVVTSVNSLVGSTASDQVGSAGVTALSNGNYIVRSSSWDNGAVVDAGAVSWGSGAVGITGVVSSLNSLVGSTASDQVGSSGVTALSNGHYLVQSPSWDNGVVVDAGAVTWGSGKAGITGVVSGLNSLAGPFQSITPTIQTVADSFLMAMIAPGILAMGRLTVPTATTVSSSSPTSGFGTSVTFTATVTAGATGTVQFFDGGTPMGAPVALVGTTATYATAALDAGVHSITAVYGGDGEFAGSTSAALTQTVQVAPAITTQPASTVVTAGGMATFTAAASGTPAPTVQWQVNAGFGFTDIPGATATSYSVTTTAFENGNRYRAVFSNAAGSATSEVATLTVNFAPSITTQPTAAVVAVGATASFTAAAIGNPAPTVQWQVDRGSGFTNIPGATATTYSVTATAGDSGNRYRAVFTNPVGSATSSPASLAVNAGLVVTTQPVGGTYLPGTTTVLTAAATGVPTPTVQWQIHTGSGWVDVAGALATTLAVVISSDMPAQNYRAVFTSSQGTATSNQAAVLAAVNVSAQVRYNLSGYTLDRSTGLFNGTMTLTNTGASRLAAFSMMLTGLTSGVVLTNATGTVTDGTGYLNVGALAPGQSVTLKLSFRKPTFNTVFGFTPKFYTTP